MTDNSTADCFISTGEASGDAVGAGIVAGIRSLRPDAVIEGMGASRMRDAGVRLWADSTGWAAIGIVQAIPMIPKMLALQRRLKAHLAAHPPRVLVLVDFGAFNVRLGRWAKEQGIPTVYAMPPASWRKQVNPKRIARLVQAADLFLSPFAWNVDNLRAAGARAEHIGHPVLDLAAPTEHAAVLERALHPVDGRLIALLPGSRRHEVEALAPTLIAAAIDWPYPADRFVMVQAPSFTDAEFRKVVRRSLPEAWRPETSDGDCRFTIVSGCTADVFHICDLAVACSGTATLEAAAALKPFVVVYNGPWLMRLEWRLRRRGVNAPMIAMPNIMAGRMVVKELIAEAATPSNIVSALRELADDRANRQATVESLEKIRNDLRPEGALMNAARGIVQFAQLV
ncbi:MAG TPA: hypothetical protein VGM37_00130 [Armatimonadota bacterium]|jgi:lipid-A-disaccharide synthase